MSLHLIQKTPMEPETHVIAGAITAVSFFVLWLFIGYGLIMASGIALTAGGYWYWYSLGKSITYDGSPSVLLGPLLSVAGAVVMTVVVWYLLG